MNLPSGLIFYLDFKYSTDQTSLHTNNGSDVYGNTSGSNVDASGGLYGVVNLDIQLMTTTGNY